MQQSDTNGFMTIQQVVNDVKVDINDFSERLHKRLIRWAMVGMEDLSISVIRKHKVVKLYVDPENFYVTVPEDMLKFLSVGIVKNGKFHRFTSSDDISTEIDSINPDDRAFNNASSIDNGTNNTYYKIYNNRIILSGEQYEFVFLKYISSGVDNEGNTLIPVEVRDALVSFIKMKLVSDDAKVPEYVINRKKQDYKTKKRELKALQIGTIEDIEDSINTRRFQYPQ